jgi:hypothetical protein
MKPEHLKFHSLLAIWTLIALLTIAALALRNIDPGRHGAVFSETGRPRATVFFSASYLMIWSAVIGAYSLGATYLAQRFARFNSRRATAFGASLFVTISAFLTVAHPHLLALTLPRRAWELYSDFAQHRLPLLAEIYYSFGLSRYKYWLLFLGVLAANGLAMVFARRAQGPGEN